MEKNIISLTNETKQLIEEKQSEMTAVEKNIAAFFINNQEQLDFTSKNISKQLFVSEATLSRFSQKCGFKGYREFIFAYEKDLKYDTHSIHSENELSIFTKKVQNSYNTLLKDNFAILDEEQMKKIADMLNHSSKIMITGMGSSGFAAMEFQLRLMRLDIDATAITDSEVMLMRAALAKEDTLVIAISLSATTKPILDTIRISKRQGAKVILITASLAESIESFCDEIVRVASIKYLDTGTKISPQLSVLFVMDILYAYCFSNDSYYKTQTYKNTLSAIRSNKEKTN